MLPFDPSQLDSTLLNFCVALVLLPFISFHIRPLALSGGKTFFAPYSLFIKLISYSFSHPDFKSDSCYDLCFDIMLVMKGDVYSRCFLMCSPPCMWCLLYAHLFPIEGAREYSLPKYFAFKRKFRK